MPHQEERDPAVEIEPMQVPDHVVQEEDRLVWVCRRRPQRLPVRAPRDLLERFLALAPPPSPTETRAAKRERPVGQSTAAAGAAGKVVDFARRYGVFAICRHGLPTTHATTAEPPVWALRRAYPQVTACLPLGAMDEYFQSRMGFNSHEGGTHGLAGWEPLTYWLIAARMLQSVVRVADALADNRPGPRDAISHLTVWPPTVVAGDPTEQMAILTGAPRLVPQYGPPSLVTELGRRGSSAWPFLISPKPDWDLSTIETLYLDRYASESAEPEPEYDATVAPLATWSTSIGTARVMLDRYVNGLLELARPHLVYRGTRERSALLTADGLFGALILQLLLHLHGATGFAICSACGQIYTPWRRPSPGSPAYCATCRTTTANARRQRLLRARRRAQRADLEPTPNTQRRRYAPELRERAVHTVLETTMQTGQQSGVVPRIARQLGVDVETLRRWVRQAEAGGDRRRPAVPTRAL